MLMIVFLLFEAVPSASVKGIWNILQIRPHFLDLLDYGIRRSEKLEFQKKRFRDPVMTNVTMVVTYMNKMTI